MMYFTAEVKPEFNVTAWQELFDDRCVIVTELYCIFNSKQVKAVLILAFA